MEALLLIIGKYATQYATYLAWLYVQICAYLYANVAAGSNAYQILRNYNVSHTWEARERLIALAGFAVLGFLQDPQSLLLTWLAFFAACLLFGLRFDIRLNTRRKLPWWYTGLDPESAWLDRQVYKFATWRQGSSAPKLKTYGKTYAALKLIGLVLVTSLALALGGCTSTRPRPADVPMLSVRDLLAPDSSAALPATVEPVRTSRPCWLNPFCKGNEPITKTTNFKNKGTIIYQVGEGHTAAAATKPGTMATGPSAAAVDAKKAAAPVQIGAANVATDNTKSGQRGGASAPGAGSTASAENAGSLPWWLVLVGIAGGAWLGAKFNAKLRWLPFLLVLLLLSTGAHAQSTRQLNHASRRYSYKEAREAKRWHRHMVRHYRRFNNREFKAKRREHQQNLRDIRRQRHQVQAQNKTV